MLFSMLFVFVRLYSILHTSLINSRVSIICNQVARYKAAPAQTDTDHGARISTAPPEQKSVSAVLNLNFT